MVHLVDSSVFVAFFSDKDTQHKKAVTLLPTLAGDVYVPFCVAVETATVLTYKHSKEQADAFIRHVINTEHLTVVADRPDEEMAHYLTVGSKVSFTDTVLLFLAKKLGAQLHTFDKQLARLARGAK